MIDEVVAQLLRSPVTVQAALDTGLEGLTRTSGFYAWWITEQALSDLPGPSHPTAPGLRLLYVGIAPRNAASSSTIRSRVKGNHLGGNTGSSTFRFALASLLRSELDLHPYPRVTPRSTNYLLPPGENARLTGWQRQHLRLTWCERAQPWEIEAAVIHRMQPPLNVAANREHPFSSMIRLARKDFRRAAVEGAR
ncbi:MAG TPA: hypothetical protein VEQ37_12465 [Actinomycetota bacterium]|nr:hypothetical protein [Actinomycetota bacterium]